MNEVITANRVKDSNGDRVRIFASRGLKNGRLDKFDLNEAQATRLASQILRALAQMRDVA